MINIKKNILISYFFMVMFSCFSQEIRESELRYKMDHGTQLMEIGKYDSAQKLFKLVIENMEVLPANIAYYFGRNSFHLKQYKQSINWLNKYVQLKGTVGRFYERAIHYLKLAEESYLAIQTKQFQRVQENLENNDFDCEGLTKMLCPVCHGSGVIVTKNIFHEFVYKTCTYSLGEGYLSCKDYNLFMYGKLTPNRIDN